MSKAPTVPGITPKNSPSNHSNLPSVVAGEPLSTNNAYTTPPCSPTQSNPHTPVIVENPLLSSYLPHIPIPSLPRDPSHQLPEPSGKWDNFPHTPSYFRGSLSFWSSRQKTIPIKSTVSSPLLSDLGFSPLSNVNGEVFEVDTGRNRVQNGSSLSDTDLTIQQSQPTMPADVNPDLVMELEKLDDIKDEVELSIEQDIPVSRVTQCNSEFIKLLINDVHSKAKKYALGMSKLSRKFPDLDEVSKAKYDSDGKSLLIKVNKHIDLLTIKLYQAPARATLQPSNGNTTSTVAPVQDSNANAAVIIAKAKVKFNTLMNMALTSKQDAEEDGVYLDTASDEKISRLVYKISKYEKLRDSISRNHDEYLEFTALHKPEGDEFGEERLSTAVLDAVNEINALIKSLESEDEERGLATLLPRKTDKMKWPILSGKAGENFLKFKETFLKVAKQNMTSRADQLTKLRENLKDFPLTLVPDTTDTIDAAFTRLASTYGDPLKLVNFELKKLEKISMVPNCEDASYTLCTRAQAEWLIQLEIVLCDLIKMGKDDEAALDLKRSVFGPQTTSLILGKFPPVLKYQLIASSKSYPEKEKLQVYLDKIKEWSQQALELEQYESDQKLTSKKSVQHLKLKDPQVNIFDPPKPLPTCIVCEELQKKQHVAQLLHISAHPTGCPLFIEMNLANRDRIASALKLCKSCLRINYSGHEKACIVNKLQK